jgi:hypothetical protein
MDTTAAPIDEQDRLKFQSREQVSGIVEGRLKHRYSQGVFVQDDWKAPNGELVIKLGVAYPKDVSDVRARDNVLKFINIDDIATLRAEPTGGGYYQIDLPEREEIYNQFKTRREQIRDQLDLSMARAIYERVYDLSPVRNQLNSIIQIVRWIRRDPPLSVEYFKDTQRSDRTEQYLEALEALDFLRIEDGMVHPGNKIEAADDEELGRIEYEKRILGLIIEDGYNYLRDHLDLRMLKHFPMYANGYYFNAIQRQRHDLWIDLDNIQSTIRMEYGENARQTDRNIVEDKLFQLHDAGVIKKDGGEVRGREQIFEQVRSGSPLPGGG